MAGRLAGKVALVTGASRGLGRAMALLFAREGAAVVVNYATREDAAREVLEAIHASGGEAVAAQADVTSKPQVSAMVDQAIDGFGHIDILVNNAGLWRPGTTVALDDAVLDELMAVNLKGAIYCTQAVVPGMRERRSGKIVNIASVAAFVTPHPENTPYSLTKAAVVALTKRLAVELGQHGINVNAICPGLILTEMSAAAFDDQAIEAFASRVILGRLGRPEELAAAALFLASDEASYITAQILTVDGGKTDLVSRSG
jgi:3-oxoacyl-[acyl-carrier protein] reductase